MICVPNCVQGMHFAPQPLIHQGILKATPGIENPRVGGSIPSRATSQIERFQAPIAGLPREKGLF
jgi:hypothetical protein